MQQSFTLLKFYKIEILVNKKYYNLEKAFGNIYCLVRITQNFLFLRKKILNNLNLNLCSSLHLQSFFM